MSILVLKSGKPNNNRKACIDCYYKQSAVSWWCTNKDATIFRHTAIPDTKNCEYWKPCKIKSDLSLWKRIWCDYTYINQIKD